VKKVQFRSIKKTYYLRRNAPLLTLCSFYASITKLELQSLIGIAWNGDRIRQHMLCLD